MFNFLIGVIFGIVISTIGFSGVATIADHGVNAVKAVARDTAH
jgi:hypothetical protein